MSVSEFERKIEKLKVDNDALRERLNTLKIDTQQAADGNQGVERFQDEEIINMSNEINHTKKDFQILLDRYKKINIVND